MNKIKTILIIIAMFLVVHFLQVNLFTWFNIAGIMPNLYVVFVLFVGLFAGKKSGVITGLIIGFIVDIVIGKTIGFSSILYGIIGYFGEYFDRNFSKDSKLMIILVSAISTIFYEIGMYVVQLVKFRFQPEVIPFIKILLIELLFNTLIIIIIYPLMKKIGYYIESRFKGKQLLTRYF